LCQSSETGTPERGMRNLDLGGDGECPAAAVYQEQGIRGILVHRLVEVRDILHGLMLDFLDDVAFPESGVGQRAGWVHVLHHYTGCRRRRSEEHTSELQSRGHLVCRLLLEKKKKKKNKHQ